MPSMRPACIRCCWRSAASATCRSSTPPQPQELLTQASAILGQGQLSLAKYLLIVAAARTTRSSTSTTSPRSSRTCCERVDWRRDLHFQTRTTIDTLDYSGARAERRLEGRHRRRRAEAMRTGDRTAGGAAAARRVPRPARRACRACSRSKGRRARSHRSTTTNRCAPARPPATKSPAPCDASATIVDAAAPDQPVPPDRRRRRQPVRRRVAQQLSSGSSFTRSNPADDIYGIDEFTSEKHWGCRGAAGDRRPHQAAPRPAAGGRPRDHPPRRRPRRPRRAAAWDHLTILTRDPTARACESIRSLSQGRRREFAE